MADIKRIGFGQIEPNHLSGPISGQVYAQLPAMDAEGKPMEIIEQGMFLKYNYAGGHAGLDGDGEFMLAYAEEKLYDERKQHHKDFALKAKDYWDGKIYPRLIRTFVGDIFTTNTFGPNTADDKEVEGLALEVGDYLSVDEATGYLKKGTLEDTLPVFQVAKVYTMPDMQPGVKIQRVK